LLTAATFFQSLRGGKGRGFVWIRHINAIAQLFTAFNSQVKQLKLKPFNVFALPGIGYPNISFCISYNGRVAVFA